MSMFYQRIRDLREDKDKGQKETAEYLKIAEKTYQRYERGENDVPLEKAVQLAKYYGVSIDYIAGLTNDKRGLTRSELSDEETDIIKKYRSLSEKRQGRILGQLEALTEEESEETKLKGAV